MINLIIKGTLAEADSAAKARGIKLLTTEQAEYGPETRAVAGPDDEGAIRLWYNEESECVQGQGYSSGTLLYFSKRSF